jgi:diguanylate cyclase (GGDEF)-like protein
VKAAAPNVARQFLHTLAVIALSAIVLLTLAASAVGWHYLRRQTQEHLHGLATVTAQQAQAAVLFEDRQNAAELLASIPAAGVERAQLHLADGRTLADVERRSGDWRASVARWFDAQTVTRDIVVDGNRIGSLVLVGSNEPIVDAMTGLILSDIVVATLLGVLALTLGTRYGERVTGPLTQLRRVMRNVVSDGDYSRRAPPLPLAEAEDLRAEFNGLLDEIERRDRDIRQANAAFERMALRDSLTGLPNRAMFERALIDAIRRGEGHELRIGLLYLDIDDFKTINDRDGHEAGDRVLAAVGERLRIWAHADAVAARLGGDEFVVLMSPFPPIHDVDALARSLRDDVEVPLDAAGRRLTPRVSVGWAVYPDTVERPEELVRAADLAMYADKRRRHGAAADTAKPPPAKEST